MSSGYYPQKFLISNAIEGQQIEVPLTFHAQSKQTKQNTFNEQKNGIQSLLRLATCTYRAVHAVDEFPRSQHQRIATHDVYPKDKQQEELVISNADTVVHPWTVVIHFNDAAAANRTVVSPSWFESATSLAVFLERIDSRAGSFGIINLLDIVG
jgi:hypothetical protein